ncbi:MAG: right-handed parallel beta-helix repeat-containing protein [Candidatus Eisenbacteria sp.]|nr:right-handed parallel beta-helix repeat-containing protein [Candidatus Eisenbacteria bacterium]
MRIFWVLGGAVACLLGLVLPAWAATLTVPVPYATIQAAVDDAQAGDIVEVGAGVYSDVTHEAGGGDTTKCVVVMKSGITVRGAGLDETIIDADLRGRGIHFYQVSDAEVAHLTVRNSDGENYGVGVLLKQSTAYLHHVKVMDGANGGIAFIQNSGGTVSHSVFEGSAGKAGAGIDVEIDCAPYFYECSIIGNSGPSNAGVQLRGDAVLDHCLIDNNTTAGDSPGGVMGGGIGILNGAPTVINCEITNNYSGGSGGGLVYLSNDPGGLIDNCVISGNTAAGSEGLGGGVLVSSLATVEITRCLVTDNSVTGDWCDGGGLYVKYAALEMSNCTFHGNSVGGSYGFAGNIGLKPLASPPHEISIAYTISAASTAGQGIWCASNPELITISCCDVYGNAGGDDLCGTHTDCFSLDPLLCDAIAGNFHVDDASPCAPGNHPGGAGTCGGGLIGARTAGCDSDVPEDLTRRAALLGNQPNPFARSTMVSFALSQGERVTLDIYDPSGRRIARLHEGWLPAGLHQASWNGGTLDGGQAGSGVYFYRLRAGDLIESMRMLRLR